jgi:eukaryotic-like serine/threonine-protein kinase
LDDHRGVTERGEAPDTLDRALRDIRPEHRDVGAALTRANLRASLFGRSEAVVVGRYTIEAQLGAGGGGEVFVAHDPELSRKVALKLLHVRGNPDRLLAEGQALARLSHPNVVPVYDTGRFGQQVYVVMELVVGATLRSYCADERRTVRDIVQAYRGAGAGLAAAHRAGFVHRDFKPDNALVGDDGRVRVVDFGLARAGEPEHPLAAGLASGVVTRAGLGTPRYMAPEQVAGDALSAATDQFAFCVSLREGVSARGAVPRWLEAIIRRGTAISPAARFPSMDAVVAALGRDPASRWKRRALLAGVVGLAGATFIIGRANHHAEPSCDPSAALGATWSSDAKSRVTARLASLRSPYASLTSPQLLARFDRYVARWQVGHRDACVLHRDGAQSTVVFDRRVACLSRAKAALAAATELAATAVDASLPDALVAVDGLPDLDRCGDASVLSSAIDPPPTELAAEVAALGEELAALEIDVRGARPDARERVAAAVTHARSLRYPPILARALYVAGRAAEMTGRRAEAIGPFNEATLLSLEAGDRALAVEAFAIGMWAESLTNRKDASLAAAYFEAIAAGLPETDRSTRAVLANAIGGAAHVVGLRDQARAAFARAVELSRGVTGPKAMELAEARSNLAMVTDDPRRASELALERVAIVETALGANHPKALTARIDAAYFEPHRDRGYAQLRAPCNGLSELHPTQRLYIVDCQFEVGWLAYERGDAAAMRSAFERVIAAAKDGFGHRVAIARAHLARLAGHEEQAERIVDAELAKFGALVEGAWWLHPLPDVPWWELLDVADLELVRGRPAVALGYLERVIATNPSVLVARRLAFARASLARAGARQYAAAAIAWYRAAGGYEGVMAELSR